MPHLILRWSLWKPDEFALTLLNHSVGTFQYFFQDNAEYVIFTDDVTRVQQSLRVSATVRSYYDFPHASFLDERATWRKWAPMCRINVRTTELRIDSDMFILREPHELFDFVSGKNGYHFLATMEEYREQWPYGNFSAALGHDFTEVNTGLIGQFAGSDLSSSLADAYRWWQECVTAESVKFHDDQGAVALALQPHIRQGRVQLLSPIRYKIACPFTTPITAIEEVVLLHAASPGHPAFAMYYDQISRASGL